MGAIRRRQRQRWRRAKPQRKLERPAKELGRQTTGRDDSGRDDSAHEQPDRLVVSALKYWEVERDLIEERLAAIRSATAAW